MTRVEATLWSKDADCSDASAHDFSDNYGEGQGGLPVLIDERIFARRVVALEQLFTMKLYQSLGLERESKDDR